MGADSAHWVSNGSTTPVWYTNSYYYTISKQGDLELVADYETVQSTVSSPTGYAQLATPYNRASLFYYHVGYGEGRISDTTTSQLVLKMNGNDSKIWIARINTGNVVTWSEFTYAGFIRIKGRFKTF